MHTCIYIKLCVTTGHITIFALASRKLIRIIGFQREWKTFCYLLPFPVSHITVAPHSDVAV